MDNTEQDRLYRLALGLAIFTVVYNIVEGVVSIYFGLSDETLSLLGFGVDSFVEVISGVGIWHMVVRIRRHEGEDPDRFERTALRITATAFYLLAVGLLATGATNLYTGHKPITTFWGNVISLVSISFMWLLIRYKVKVGTALGSQAIIADAHCSRACMQFSIVLLVASLGYQLTGIGHIDSIGALVIGWLALREGREAHEKARGKASCGCGSSCTDS
jgi:divalent metal cation (Fe/Co/Zn/Cd) transporter